MHMGLREMSPTTKEKLEVSPILIGKWGPEGKTWSSFPCIPRGITKVLMERKRHGIWIKEFRV